MLNLSNLIAYRKWVHVVRVILLVVAIWYFGLSSLTGGVFGFHPYNTYYLVHRGVFASIELVMPLSAASSCVGIVYLSAILGSGTVYRRGVMPCAGRASRTLAYFAGSFYLALIGMGLVCLVLDVRNEWLFFGWLDGAPEWFNVGESLWTAVVVCTFSIATVLRVFVAQDNMMWQFQLPAVAALLATVGAVLAATVSIFPTSEYVWRLQDSGRMVTLWMCGISALWAYSVLSGMFHYRSKYVPVGRCVMCLYRLNQDGRCPECGYAGGEKKRDIQN